MSFLSDNFQFLEVKFSNLNSCVFEMIRFTAATLP